MKKKLAGLSAILLLSTSLAACGGGDEAKETPKSEPTTKNEEKATKSTGNVVEVTLTASNFQFDKTEVQAKAGDTVRFTLANEAGHHGVGLDEFDMNLKAGETFEFVVNETGEFEFYCNIPCGAGHDTMIGKLIVT